MLLINWSEEVKTLKGVFNPKVVAFCDDHRIVLSRFLGEYQFHRHDTDEFFLVLKGKIAIETKEREFHLETGDALLMPKETFHRSKAKEEAIVLMFERKDLKTFFE
jgi:mannose-6-phosphate isomerase-like protein (cupin superfamily)|uniref:Cupin domain-containing protein n=1 Tax=candidate division WOR-3 bacterium TaxID=2052148 RepID=A0A7C3Z2X8_UNCW3